jgi:pimeloyl-ACP methyl ester carboxylesterase
MPEKIQVGKFHSRGLWTKSTTSGKRPAVILIPGSGPNGPEEMMPPEVTVDRKSHSIFESISQPFFQANWNVLSLGKPGIEFHSGSWAPEKLFYDKDFYMHIKWGQLIENLDEGLKFLKSQPSVDSKKIFILGHSQGTQVAVEYASHHPDVAGLILIGYSAEDYKTILEWQIFKRPIEHFVATDVDLDHDGFVSRAEAAKWPGPLNLDDAILEWNFRPGKNKISYAEIEEDLRSKPENQKLIRMLKEAPFLANGLYDRGPLYKMAAQLKMPLYVFTGSLDLLTPPKEALKLQEVCKDVGKKNCEVHIVSGLGHGFSPPRGPRKHPLLDITVGPVEQSFLDLLGSLITRL